jgi:hypothetical protein
MLRVSGVLGDIKTQVNTSHTKEDPALQKHEGLKGEVQSSSMSKNHEMNAFRRYGGRTPKILDLRDRYT